MFTFLFGNKKLSSYLKSGAIVIDVRSGAEFDTGSALGAKNIPLNTLESRTEEIKASGKPVITVVGQVHEVSKQDQYYMMLVLM